MGVGVLIAIAAADEADVIGADGGMPWRISSELQWFKRLTMGGTLAMGRKTFESIGKPLPGRRTVVLSRSGVTELPTQDYVYLCGGADVYRQFLPSCDMLVLSRVPGIHKGDRHLEGYARAMRLDRRIEWSPEFSVEVWLTRRPKTTGPLCRTCGMPAMRECQCSFEKDGIVRACRAPLCPVCDCQPSEEAFRACGIRGCLIETRRGVPCKRHREE